MSRSPGGAARVAALNPIAMRKTAASVLAAAAVLGASVSLSAPALAAKAPTTARPAGDDAQPGRALGLPSLDTAQRYNLSPASRTLRPQSLDDATPVDADFVTAASPASEEDAHRLDADPTSRRTRVGGSWVRSAGANEPLAEFSYALMRPPGGGGVRLRIEEAGAESSQYDVLVNGVKIHHRGPNPQERGLYGGQVGLVHYELDVPRAALRKGGRDARRFRVTFRNSDDPGPGARIAQVWAIATGDAGRDPAPPYGGSVRNARALVSGRGSATLRGDVLSRPYAILDFGKEVGGDVTVRAKRLDGAPKVSFAFSESKQFMTSASDYSADPVGVVTETQTVKVPAGTTTISPPDGRGGFRYLMVWLTGPGAVELSDLKLQFDAAPLQRDLRDYAGAFLSSDDELNRFWYSGAYTVQLSTIDPASGRRYPAQPGPPHNDARIGEGPSVIVDAPKRDRFIWGGDLVVANPVAYLTTHDTLSPQLAFDWLAKKPSAGGQPAGVYIPLPGDGGWWYNWGEYALWWIVNYEAHYRYTADRAFLDRWFDQLVGAVRWARANVGADDLLVTPGDAGGHWGYGLGGKETYNNALLVHALRIGAQAAEAEGRADLAADWRAAADRTAAAINRSLWDEAAGAYVLAPGSDAHPQDANALAVLSGAAPADRAARVLSFFKRNWTAIGSPTVDREGTAVPRYVSPFVSTFELDAFAGNGRVDDALELLKRTWGHMLQGDSTGTFWENISLAGGPQLGSYTSYSHGWAAGPTSFLTNTVLGVKPTAPGFSQFTVTPHVPSGLNWAQGRVPTPKGAIYAAWKRSRDGRLTVAVSAPAGTSYSVQLPGATERATGLSGSTTTTLTPNEEGTR
jgi:hypothetical protein